uniref:RNA-directed RNA polymerase n=1 Tax=Caenorhabditis tropicalis TaxID=1561998 RepID=A0A1I7U5Y1_9PELO
MTESSHGFIKLEFPESNVSKQEMKQVIESMAGCLEPCLEEYSIQVIERQPTQVVEEQDCDCYFEVNFEVCSQKFDHSIIEAMRDYLDQLTDVPAYRKPNIVLHSADFWKSQLETDVRAVPLSAIYFGNIQGNTYLNHWEISFWDEVKERTRRRNAKETPLYQIEVDFEFDKTDMITVKFQCMEKEIVKKNNNKTNNNNNTNNIKTTENRLVNYQVMARRDTIRRIIVDPNVRDCYGSRTLVHFELNAPPVIRKGRIDKDKESNAYHQPFFKRWKTFENLKWKTHGFPKETAISDSPFFTIDFREDLSSSEIYRILCRLRARTRVSIEFAHFQLINVPVGHRTPYARWAIQDGYEKPATDSNVPVFRDFLLELFPPNYEIVDGKSIDLNDERKFAITYLIECLLSRGAIVKDQLLLTESQWERFLEIIIIYYKIDDKLCEAALEDLVHLIDGRKRIGCIVKCLARICNKRQQMQTINGLSEKEIKAGYQIVRKVIFTPTRVIYVAPETIMGNRVLRKFDKDGTRVLRITFRDDNNARMRTNVTEELLEKTAHKYLEYGVRVANRDFAFLGCSNSQMRDNGAYFMVRYTQVQLEKYLESRGIRDGKPPASYKPLIMEVRRHLGKFENTGNVPKMMARLGQCFTQSRLTGVELNRSNYMRTFDLEGGKTVELVGDKYTFSDGVGLMSYQFAQDISRMMNFDKSVPSCFQIRFRGMKGVIAVDPFLDEYRQWTKILGLPKQFPEIKCAFRPSQIKFEAKCTPEDQIEMVKFSSPVLVALNKPFINIMDQVSEMQSVECHRRITNRIEELMDRQVQSFAKQINDETYCRNKLKEFPRRVDIDGLRTIWGFTLSREPFFRSLIKASIKFSITKQLRKEQIQIPKELGRSMLGVVDETGLLQYGQIFVQYSRNSTKKLPPRLDNRKIQGAVIVTGTVVLTKNPCIVPGDVRIFEAVDVPELHHMCDVVVFPQHGSRPHPDEMAGSDLDGDEYSVIWDQQLLLDRNEDPFDFSVEKKKEPIDMSKVDQLMREFYVKYLMLDSVGQISNAHLHNSDQYGLTSRVCMDLAKKNCQAVDFTKSGTPPESLTKKWTNDPITDEAIPPENPERIPDFHMGNERNPQYVSPRLCGRLFREFQSIDSVIKISEEQDERYDIEIDQDIRIAGSERYKISAEADLANYNGQLRSIMETYGIATEGEIMSGCIVEMRNRISDKDQDDMSFFNTNQMIETRVTTLVCKFREKFFEEFGGFQFVCVLRDHADGDSNCLNWICTEPTNAMLQKGAAWYNACYEFAQTSRETRKLSFAWLIFDIIAKIKEYQALRGDEIRLGGTNPMYTFLEGHRKQFIEDHQDEFVQFCTFEKFIDKDKCSEKAISIIRMYTTTHPGLDTVLFMLMKWGEVSNLFEDQPLEIYHFFLIFILFATNQFPTVDGKPQTLFRRIELDEYNGDPGEKLTETQRSQMMVKFLEFMASRNFRKLKILSFRSLQFSSVFLRGEWNIYHVAALKTYFNIMFNLRFEELPISSDKQITKGTVIREGEPFVIELPVSEKINYINVLDSLKKRSGCEEIQMRQQSNRMEQTNNGKGKLDDEKEEEKQLTVRYLVSACGTLESMQRLRELCAVTIPIKNHLGGKNGSKQMAFLCLHKILEGFER